MDVKEIWKARYPSFTINSQSPPPPPSPKQPPSAVPPTNKKVPQEQAGMYSENNESKLDKKWRVWQVPDKIKPKPENKQIEIDNIQKEEFTEHREIQYNIKNIMKKTRLELKDNQINQDNIMFYSLLYESHLTYT